MSARKIGGNATRGGVSRHAGRAAALTASRFTWQSMTCPRPAVKLRTPPASAVRGSRASTDPSTQRGVYSASRLPCCDAGPRFPLPSLSEDKTSLCQLRARPCVVAADLANLFNPAEGLSMAKPARFSLRPASKFVPVADLQPLPKMIRGSSRKPLI
jgi:hypothetical protein